MKKLRLNVDTLAVVSFPTVDVASEMGTVHGAEADATRTSCGGFPECTCPPPTA